MKKVLLSLTSLGLFLILAACGQETADSTEAVYSATLTVTFTDNTVQQEVTFEEGDSVMDVLEDYHEVEESNGMVTAIDGVSQDAASNTYWMYDVNGELAPKGAEEQLLAEGDTIEFYLETFE